MNATRTGKERGRPRAARRTLGRAVGGAIGLGLAAGILAAPVSATVRPAGQGAAFAPAAAGPAAASWNPAGLSLHPERRIEFFALQAGLGNDRFTLRQYADLNGGFWGDEDKQAVLDGVGGGALTVSGQAALRAAGVSIGPLAFTSETRGASRACMPKEALELLLYGNTVGETFDLNGASAVGIAFTEVRASAAGPAERLLAFLPTAVKGWHLGASAKMLVGWGYWELLEARGGVTTTVESLAGDGSLRYVTARRGHGFGFDLGVARRLGRDWTICAAARDVAARITWDAGVEERTDTFEAPAISLGDGDEVAITESVTVPLTSVSTHLPVLYSAGVARTGERLLATLHLEAAGERRLGASPALRAAAGAAWTFKPWLAVRASLSVGGEDRATVGGGAGLALGRAQVDVGLRSWGSLNPFASKGLGAETSVGLAF